MMPQKMRLSLPSWRGSSTLNRYRRRSQRKMRKSQRSVLNLKHLSSRRLRTVKMKNMMPERFPRRSGGFRAACRWRSSKHWSKGLMLSKSGIPPLRIQGFLFTSRLIETPLLFPSTGAASGSTWQGNVVLRSRLSSCPSSLKRRVLPRFVRPSWRSRQTCLSSREVESVFIRKWESSTLTTRCCTMHSSSLHQSRSFRSTMTCIMRARSMRPRC
mmetsp:Transcript_28372/g.53227  ORF Transcript_28372/g.53227 Transcript_28372/m.53227 type:complete len:214 (-) Transcript_28372:29-670(-)